MMKSRFAALILVSLSLSACGGANLGIESTNQPVVSRSDYAFDVATGSSGLAGAEAARLAGWFDGLKLGYGDKVAVDFGGNYDSGEAKASIASVAARYGLLLQDVPPLTSGDIAPGAARVIVSRLKASVPDCPKPGYGFKNSFQNATSPNYGCSTNTNLAAMVADPEHLVRGESSNGSLNTVAATKGVVTHRNKAPSGAGGLAAESVGKSQ